MLGARDEWPCCCGAANYKLPAVSFNDLVGE